MRRVLITGAAGRIGSFLAHAWQNRYDLVLTDQRAMVDPPDARFVIADVADLEVMHTLCRDIDTVVHLAADPRVHAPWETLLPANVIGAYHVFQAALDAGCRRVVFASSINAIAGYPHDTQVHTGMPLRPLNLYGATKAWGEVLGRFYADQTSLSVICLRFGAVLARDDRAHLQPGSSWLSITITLDDLSRLVQASIEAPESVRYGVFHGLSNNRWKRFDISDARSILGYEPQDDAFLLAEQTPPTA